MRASGHLLLWLGFIGAAFASVSHLEQPDDKWGTIAWVWYAGSMAVGIIGVAMLRHTKRADHADDEKTEAEYSVVQQSLAKLCSAVQTLCQESPKLPSQILHLIDQQCAEPFSDFAEARQSLVKRFGLSVYADVMTEFASAERYVNRSWSAAADGYIDEVTASLNRANQHLANARELLAAAERSSAAEATV
jgi:hypothetical protein